MFKELLKKISLTLDKNAIPYMVIGGQAVLLYGEPRLTRDIDITLGASLDRLEEVVALTRSIGLKSLVEPDSFTRKTMVLPSQDLDNGIRVDFIFSDYPYEQQAINRARKVKIDDVEVSFATVEDLIIHKIIAGRPRDMEDVKNVVIKHESFDKAYIAKWLSDFSDHLGEPFLDRFNSLCKEVE